MAHQTTLGLATALALGSLLAATSTGCAGSPASPTPVPREASSAASAEPAGTSAAQAGYGNSPYRLGQAGWVCVNVPGHGVHCQDPHIIQGGVHIQVKVFDTSDVDAREARFLGTESLIRADRYNGQPCLPGHGEYFLLPFGYYACHHFDF